MKTFTCLTALAVTTCAIPQTALADFQYREQTQVTGGSVMNMMKMAGALSSKAREANAPVISNIFIKGNRMLRQSKLTSEIIDLDKETITNIDHTKKQYTVETFEQMKEAMEAAAARARAEQAKQKPQATAQTVADKPPDNVEMHFTTKVRNTNATKQLSGIDAKEAILNMTLEGKDTTTGQTGAMAITNDMWMAPDIPGYQEVRDFQKRMAKKMGELMNGAITPQMLSTQPSMGKGMGDLVNEMSKLKGMPILQIMRIGTTTNGQPLPAASEAPLPPSPEMPSMKDVAAQTASNTANTAAQDAQNSATSKIASKMGNFGNLATGLGGFGRKKRQQPPAPDPSTQNASGTPPPVSVLIETNSEMSGFSTQAVDPSVFAIPAGYQLVQPQAIPPQ